ncbi:hypothetical protein [Limimaricola cinnabarinus]|uniref:Uncharacterized protein n=1 Tax=Limimaricola cinnabarinus LL-001 TaxID=1337093 RepID=U3ADG1_9RHOB|nr:hypothetical protein [Limimaricola cinnabarinus]GAD55714.1 hypothetical protein MBELCI_1766 [Limimaricola cinnabarinus LL-001]
MDGPGAAIRILPEGYRQNDCDPGAWMRGHHHGSACITADAVVRLRIAPKVSRFVKTNGEGPGISARAGP